MHGKVAYLFFRWISAEVEWNEKGGLKYEYDCVWFLYFHSLFFLPEVLSLQITFARPYGNLSFIIIRHSGPSQWRGGEWNEARYLWSFSCCVEVVAVSSAGTVAGSRFKCPAAAGGQWKAIFSWLIMDSPISFDDNPWIYKVQLSRRPNSSSSRGAEIASRPSSRLFCLHLLLQLKLCFFISIQLLHVKSTLVSVTSQQKIHEKQTGSGVLPLWAKFQEWNFTCPVPKPQLELHNAAWRVGKVSGVCNSRAR